VTQPNIVLILADQLRRDALEAWMPNLVQLAGESGTRFANAYCASPLCQPGRVSLVTGMYPSQTGVCGNQSEPVPATLRDDTFMHHLQEAGYFTALIGKHHFIDRYGIAMDLAGDDAEIGRYGFDRVFQVAVDGQATEDEYSHYLREKGLHEEYWEAEHRSARACGPHPLPVGESADGFIALNGIRFIEEHARGQPFYLNLSFVGPHPPYWHPGELYVDPDRVPGPIGVPDTLATRERRAHYMQKCRLIDDLVARFVGALAQHGLLDNTVVIFTSDHGDNLGDFGIWDKRFFYEASAGVPMLILGRGVPRQTRGNGPRVSKLLVSHLDLYPTVLALAGVDMPRDRRRPGIDLLSQLAGSPRDRHSAVFAELATSAMIRTANWKLVFDPEQGGVQHLYNMVVDPMEQHNLAGVAGYESVTLELVQQLLASRIMRTQYTHVKEEQRLQRVCVRYRA
jgi:choline-sulfatase